MFKIKATILFLLSVFWSRAQDVPFHTDLVFIDDSVCVLKIDYETGEKTYITGIYKLQGTNFYFSEISKGFEYLVYMEFSKNERISSDSMEIELLITDPLGYGWTSLDSLKFQVNGVSYQSSLIPYKNDDFVQSHYVKIGRPLERMLLLEASCQDSGAMMSERIFFLKDILLENGYPNKLFFKLYTFGHTDPKRIPLKKLLPPKVVRGSRTYNVMMAN